MTPETPSISPTLLERVRNRDDSGWNRLVMLFGPLVRGWCSRGGVRTADLDDVVQEVFLKVSKSLDGFRKEKPGDTFLGWLRTVTRNRVADYHAARGETAAGGTDARNLMEGLPQVEDEELLSEDARHHIVRETLATLRNEFNERTWAVFMATAIDDRPIDVAAKEHGMSVGAVYVARSRVLQRLRRELEDIIPI